LLLYGQLAAFTYGYHCYNRRNAYNYAQHREEGSHSVSEQSFESYSQKSEGSHGENIVNFYIFIMSLPVEITSKIVQSLMGLDIYKVILFGSHAKGTATEDSDIDLVVVLNSDEMSQKFNDRMNRRRPVSRSLLEINRQYPMDILVYTKAEFDYLKNRKDFFVQEIEETGKELYGK
jgi:predicted nucleotidyltransferase